MVNSDMCVGVGGGGKTAFLRHVTAERIHAQNNSHKQAFKQIPTFTQIVKAVISHESALKAQAKKMNVESLRSNAVSKIIFFPKLTHTLE